MEQCRGGCSHEMVNSPATAATMAYPTLEEERRSSWHEQHDNDYGGCCRRQRQRNVGQAVDYHETETLRRDLDSFSVVCSPCIEQHDDHRHVHDESCTGCHSRGSTATILNRDFAHSHQQPVPGPSKQLVELPTGLPCPTDGRIQRRSRKQSQPRKVTEVEEDEDLICSGEGIKQEEEEEEEEQEQEQEKEGQATEKPESQIAILKDKYRSPSNRKTRSLKCRQCPRNSLARGCICPPYHSKASLLLHNLWRHNKKTRTRTRTGTRTQTQTRDRLENQAPNNDNPVSQVSSITLKATVYTNPARYDYHS